MAANHDRSGSRFTDAGTTRRRQIAHITKRTAYCWPTEPGRVLPPPLFLTFIVAKRHHGAHYAGAIVHNSSVCEINDTTDIVGAGKVTVELRANHVNCC